VECTVFLFTIKDLKDGHDKPLKTEEEEEEDKQVNERVEKIKDEDIPRAKVRLMIQKDCIEINNSVTDDHRLLQSYH
jgi:hypothetical protein